MTWTLRAVAVVALIQSADAVVIFVDDSATGANNGSSWSDAYIDLHDGLAAARSGDEIRIGQGVYKPAGPGGDRNATFTLVNGVLIQGGFAGDGAPDPDQFDPQKFSTILSGDLNGDDGLNFQNYDENSYNVIYGDGVDEATVLRGLIIRGGNANYYPPGSPPNRQAYGGALVALNGTPTLIACEVRENRTHYGGGGGIRAQGITLVRCRFIANAANAPAMPPGGALWISGPGEIEDCVFQSNYADNAGGAVIGGNPLKITGCRFVFNGSNEAGGALSGSFTVLNTDFIGNGAYHGAGAASCGKSTFVNCRFLGNGGGCFGFANGSAIHSWGNVSAINCIFSGNGGSYSTFAAHEQSSTEPNLIANCTFVGNNSVGCPGSAIFASAGTVIVNSIIWSNQYNNIHSPPPNPIQASQISVAPETVLANNGIEGWDGSLGGYGNFGADPQFIDANGADDVYGTEDDNPRLSESSPCRDAGNNSHLPPDTFDLDEDGNITEPIPFDLDSLPRIVSSTVDLGAYEIQSPGCPADSSGDGQVNSADLLAILNQWGQCTSSDCPADITNDGSINTSDLLFVLAHWGACPPGP